jgi:hypothetical protein
MPEMDQSRLTTEELAFLHNVSADANELKQSNSGYERGLGDDYARLLQIIRRLAGDKPPADSIRVYECTCGYRSLQLGKCRSHPYPMRGMGPQMTEHIYVPAGDKPDREAMVERAAQALASMYMEYDVDDNYIAEARAVVDALYPPEP